MREAAARGLVELRFRHQVDELVIARRRGDRRARRGARAERRRRGGRARATVAGEFALDAQAVFVTSGGIGANHELVRRNWPERLGTPPKAMIAGVPDHVDGRMIEITAGRGRQRHQPRPDVALRRGHPQLGPDLDQPRDPHPPRARRRCGSTRSGAGCRRRSSPASTRSGRSPTSCAPGHEHTWFVLTQKIIEKEFALSGSEQNPDITGREHARGPARAASARGAPPPVEAFKHHGADFVVERDLRGARARDERADRRAAARPRRAGARDRGPRPRDREPVREGHAGHGDPRRAGASWPTA